jgi:hypothetical protein
MPGASFISTKPDRCQAKRVLGVYLSIAAAGGAQGLQLANATGARSMSIHIFPAEIRFATLS